MDDDAYFKALLTFYESMPRLGPGDDRYTRFLYRLLTDLPDCPRIADMGCGNGSQTIVLAGEGGDVTAVDLNGIFFSRLLNRAEKLGLSNRIHVLETSMDALPDGVGPFDLIWSEGAVYFVGFARGLRLWKPLLKDGGYIVVSEATWLTDSPPAGLKSFWDTEYPAMQTRSANEAVIRDAGYRWIGSVLLPEEAWAQYYRPQIGQIAALRTAGVDGIMEQVISDIEKEIEIFNRYRGLYGYVFYLMQKS